MLSTSNLSFFACRQHHLDKELCKSAAMLKTSDGGGMMGMIKIIPHPSLLCMLLLSTILFETYHILVQRGRIVDVQELHRLAVSSNCKI